MVLPCVEEGLGAMVPFIMLEPVRTLVPGVDEEPGCIVVLGIVLVLPLGSATSLVRSLVKKSIS